MDIKTSLSGTDKTVKILFIIAMMAGYTFGLLTVFYHTDMNTTGVEDYFRGDEETMKFEKSVAELLVTTHNHLFGMGMAFFIFAVLFSNTSLEFRGKSFFVTEPLISLFITITCFWLVRFVSPHFSLLMMLSSSLMSLGFYAQGILTIYDMRSAKN